jgi:hypothetical protein
LYDASFLSLSSVFPVSYEERFLYENRQIPDVPFILSDDTSSSYQRACHARWEVCSLIAQQELYVIAHWLRDIQYLGHTMTAEEVPYFPELVDSLTKMAPYWPSPYIFAQTFGPINKTSTVSETDKYLSWQKTAQIWEKWAYYTCDMEKVARIAALSEGEFLSQYSVSGSDLHIPCTDYRLPHSLAFTYFYYLQDYANAQKRYRVAAFDPAAPDVTASMSALVAGSLWYHLTSMSLRFQKYVSVTSSDVSVDVSLEAQRYLHKAVMELTLYLIQKADTRAKMDFLCFRDLSCLLEKWYLASVIKKELTVCLHIASTSDITDHACKVLQYAMEQNYISADGLSIRYPFSSEQSFVYGRHPTLETWWVLPVE